MKWLPGGDDVDFDAILQAAKWLASAKDDRECALAVTAFKKSLGGPALAQRAAAQALSGEELDLLAQSFEHGLSGLARLARRPETLAAAHVLGDVLRTMLGIIYCTCRGKVPKNGPDISQSKERWLTAERDLRRALRNNTRMRIAGAPLNGLNLVVSTLELGTTCLRDPRELQKVGKALLFVGKVLRLISWIR